MFLVYKIILKFSLPCHQKVTTEFTQTDGVNLTWT